MASVPTVKVGYNKVFAAVLLSLAVLNVGLGLVIGPSTTLFVGVLLVVIAILELVMPYFVLVDGAVLVKNIYGMTMRRYPFDHLSQFEISEDGKIIHITDVHGVRKRVKVTRWISDGRDWRRFVNVLASQAFD